MFRTTGYPHTGKSPFGLRQLSAALAGCLLCTSAVLADPVTPSTSNALDAGVDLVRERMEEIVVYASRDQNDASSDELLADPLRARIMKEIRELNVLDEEFEWRLETASLTLTPPRVRYGYDPRNDERTASTLMVHALPLDLMQPATIFSVDF